ncbi:breast cancer type 1 susceptibility protein isoform X2 [Ascaphus truei]|uniref:breast cancer type 1 susceptibility protein isoform X2 n=1 Tax=Ascaphus truei TaxID=8439 RepID=UPI003F59D464
MPFPALDVEEVHNVISVMQKNLECPICLDLMKEPVATRCDHIFCRFCMLQLLSKKKKGLAQCPMCKDQVTKRSLQDSPRFKLLAEGLLTIIHAFELDSGYKFLPSQETVQTVVDGTGKEQPGKQDLAVVQCTGYRSRRKRILSNDAVRGERSTGRETSRDLAEDVGRGDTRGHKRPRQEAKPVLVKFVSDSSEDDLFKKADSLGSAGEGRSPPSESGEAPMRSDNRESDIANDRASLKPDAEDTVASDLAEYGFSERDLESTRGNLLRVDRLGARTEKSAKEGTPETRGHLISDTEDCERKEQSFHSEIDLDLDGSLADSEPKKTTKQVDSSQWLDKQLDDPSTSKVRSHLKEREALKTDIDDQYDKENSLLEESQVAPGGEGDLTPGVSKKRMRRSIQRVNEWLSKADGTSNSSPWDDYSLSDVFPLEEEDVSDQGSCTSDGTEIMPKRNQEFVPCEPEKTAKSTFNIEDQIFGKVYKRERKSNPHQNRACVTNGHTDHGAVEPVKENETPKVKLRRKRNRVSDLQPEDFIKKADTTMAIECIDRCPIVLDNCTLDDNGGQVGNTSTTKGSDFFPLEKAPSWNTDNDKVETGHNDLETMSDDPKHDTKTKREKSRPRSKPEKKRWARSAPSLTLVGGVELGTCSVPSPFDHPEPQIESYPSSEEPRTEAMQRNVRRSRRLQLLPGEPLKAKSDINDGVMKVTSTDPKDGESNPNQDVIHKTGKKASEDTRGGNHSLNKNLSPRKTGEKHLSLDDEDSNTQISTSLLLLNHATTSQEIPCGQANADQRVNETGIQSSASNCDTPARVPNNDQDGCRGPAPQVVQSVLQEAHVETEDSELETEYLLKTFKSAKRLSFILQRSPVADKNKENFDPKARQEQRVDSGGHGALVHATGLYIDLPNGPQMGGTLQTVSEQGNSGSYNSIVEGTGQITANGEFGDQTVLPLPEQGLPLPRSKNRRSLRTKKKPSLSPEEFVQNSAPSTCSLASVLSSSVETDGQMNGLYLINKAVPSEECNQVENAAASQSKGLLLHSETESMQPFPPVTRQSPAAVNRRCTGSGASHGENEQATSDGQSCPLDEEQVNQIPSANGTPGSMTERLLGHPTSPTGSMDRSPEVDLSTPEGLLCYSAKPKDDASFCDAADKSVVFGADKKSKDQESIASPLSGSQKLGKRKKRQAQKLESSEEESSEDEDLPCFQALVFGKSSGPGSNSTGPKISLGGSTKEEHGGVLALFSSSSEKTQPSGKVPRAAFPSLSQGSECSVNLFSSQSNMSEHSLNGPDDHKQRRSQPKSREGSPKGTGRNEQERIDAEDGHPEDQGMEKNLGEGSGYESEASHTGDSSGPSSQGELLTSQQRDAMQNNLKQLQQEMAALEAVLEQQETQGTGSPREGAAAAAAPDVTLSQREAREKPTDHGADIPSNPMAETEERPAVEPPPGAELQRSLGDAPCAIRSVSPTPPPPPQTKQRKETPERVRLSTRLLKELKESVVAQDDDTMVMEPPDSTPSTHEPDGTPATRLNRARAPTRQSQRNKSQGADTGSPTSKTSLSGRAAGAAEAPGAPRQAGKDAGSGRKATPLSASPAPSRVGSTGMKSPVVSTRKIMSMVASGLSQKELVLVQKFARKTQGTFTNQITAATTHVIMKTDAAMVCERTLKYFLGIAGRKWVLSYQWIVQSFKAGKILDERDFEVTGDVINGRNHSGPRRSRLGSGGLLLKDFAVCCCGAFTDLTPENLEWMASLCGAFVVKEPQQFKRKPVSTWKGRCVSCVGGKVISYSSKLCRDDLMLGDGGTEEHETLSW